MRVLERGQGYSWASASTMGGVPQTDRITARSNFGESSLDDRRKIPIALTKGRILLSEPELEPKSGSEGLSSW